MLDSIVQKATDNFIEEIRKSNIYREYVFQKEKLKKVLGKTEILTVAEAKGLERNTVILVDVLSDNADKWRYLSDMSLNRKTADENSVFRYYFNLFYVGISRARQYLFVTESDCPQFFDGFFNECFERRGKDSALALLKEIAGRIEVDDDELRERIETFCSLEQYENANEEQAIRETVRMAIRRCMDNLQQRF